MNQRIELKSLSDEELDRYARHIVLREIGGPGQTKLKNSSVLVVGAGGLGSPALMYLNAVGVGRIGVVDFDTVSRSNLQRQIVHDDDSVGLDKSTSSGQSLARQNPNTVIETYRLKVDEGSIESLTSSFDIVLDGTDSFRTRCVVNKSCVDSGTVLVYGAISQWEGQVGVFLPSANCPCYNCIFPREPEEGVAPSCAEVGVVGALPGIIGSIMAMEVIKVLTGAGQPLARRLLIYDALYANFMIVKTQRRTDCCACGNIA